MLKINNKYKYFEKTKKPLLSDFENEKDYIIAKTLFNLQKECGFLVSAKDAKNKVKLKTTKTRLPNKEIKNGNTIFVERWDGNGIPDEVKVVNIKYGKTRAVVKTNKGFFVLSIWNSKKDDIEFNWTCKDKKWEKQYKKWVDGNRYFLREKTDK